MEFGQHPFTKSKLRHLVDETLLLPTMAKGHPPHRSKLGLPGKEEDADPTRLASPALGALVGGGLRKKGIGVRPWLLLDSTGVAQVVDVGKHAIMRRTGLPARDLRMLDPLLSYPSTILGRERAIVINLEHIKAIITAQEVLLLNSKDPSVTPLVEELQRRILRHHQATIAHEGEKVDSNWTDIYGLEEARSRAASPENPYQGFPESGERKEERKEGGKQGVDDKDELKVLPFEFVALEACLESTCTNFETEVKTLEKEAYPTVDKLTSQISTLNLERVRQIKSRLVAISGRVQKMKDELEHLLDDNEDMAEMYLTEKLAQQQLESSSMSSIDDEDEALPSDIDIREDKGCSFIIKDHQSKAEISVDDGGCSSSHESDVKNNGEPQRTSTTHSGLGKQLDVEELEMLLEAYFVQIDGTSNKLSTLREYVDDTEDYINIMLDDKQNQLLRMGVMISTTTLVMTAFLVLAGVFGMNIRIELFKVAGMHQWLQVVAASVAGWIFLNAIVFAWYKYKRLL